jgi:hypothetical protein
MKIERSSVERFWRFRNSASCAIALSCNSRMLCRTIASILAVSLTACSSMPRFDAVRIPWLKRDSPASERHTVAVMSIVPDPGSLSPAPEAGETGSTTFRTFDLQNAIRTGVGGALVGALAGAAYCFWFFIVPPAYAGCIGTMSVAGGAAGTVIGAVKGPKEKALRELDSLQPDLLSHESMSGRFHGVLMQQARGIISYQFVDLGTVTAAQYAKHASGMRDTLVLRVSGLSAVPAENADFHIVVRVHAQRNNSVWSRLSWGSTYHHQSPAISFLAGRDEKLTLANSAIDAALRHIACSILRAEFNAAECDFSHA